jgi:hypothetical protein
MLYIVFINSTDPDPIGPFETIEAAEAFGKQHCGASYYVREMLTVEMAMSNLASLKTD